MSKVKVKEWTTSTAIKRTHVRGYISDNRCFPKVEESQLNGFQLSALFLSTVDSPDKYHIRHRPPLNTGGKSGVRLLLRFSGIRRNLTHDGNFTQAEISTHIHVVKRC